MGNYPKVVCFLLLFGVGVLLYPPVKGSPKVLVSLIWKWSNYPDVWGFLGVKEWSMVWIWVMDSSCKMYFRRKWFPFISGKSKLVKYVQIHSDQNLIRKKTQNTRQDMGKLRKHPSSGYVWTEYVSYCWWFGNPAISESAPGICYRTWDKSWDFNYPTSTGDSNISEPSTGGLPNPKTVSSMELLPPQHPHHHGWKIMICSFSTPRKKNRALNCQTPPKKMWTFMMWNQSNVVFTVWLMSVS